MEFLIAQCSNRIRQCLEVVVTKPQIVQFEIPVLNTNKTNPKATWAQARVVQRNEKWKLDRQSTKKKKRGCT
jgi:hypothetical protein